LLLLLLLLLELGISPGRQIKISNDWPRFVIAAAAVAAVLFVIIVEDIEQQPLSSES